jgi:hypothetical protein
VMFSRRMAHSPMTSLSYVRSIKWDDDEWLFRKIDLGKKNLNICVYNI